MKIGLFEAGQRVSKQHAKGCMQDKCCHLMEPHIVVKLSNGHFNESQSDCSLFIWQCWWHKW